MTSRPTGRSCSPWLTKRKTRPAGANKNRINNRSSSSSLTALRVITSAECLRSRRVAMDSKRHSSTNVDSNWSVRTDSRRNEHFLDLVSTIRILAADSWVLNGMAGEPPPDPRSMTRTGSVPTNLAAATGSTINLSTAASVSGSISKEVRLIFRFHRISKSTYKTN